MSDSEKPTGSNPADSGTPETASPEKVQSTQMSSDTPLPAEASTRKRLVWPRMTVIILFALAYAYDLFEAISDMFGVSAQIAKYNENATLIGINTIAVPWAVLVANMLLPIVVFFLVMLVSRKRNFGILALVFLAGLAVVAALSLSLTVLAGVLTR